MVLYERLGVFSIFQTDLLGYKWVSRGRAAVNGVKSTALSHLPYAAHAPRLGMGGTEVTSCPIWAVQAQPISRLPTPGFPESTPQAQRGWLLHPKQGCYPHTHSIRMWKRC